MPLLNKPKMDRCPGCGAQKVEVFLSTYTDHINNEVIETGRGYFIAFACGRVVSCTSDGVPMMVPGGKTGFKPTAMSVCPKREREQIRARGHKYLKTGSMMINGYKRELT